MTQIKRVSPENLEGVIEDMTPEEQTQHDADVVRLAQEQTDREAATTAREAEEAQTAIDKASAKAKLQAAEYTPLTEAEADTIVL